MEPYKLHELHAPDEYVKLVQWKTMQTPLLQTYSFSHRSALSERISLSESNSEQHDAVLLGGVAATSSATAGGVGACAGIVAVVAAVGTRASHVQILRRGF